MTLQEVLRQYNLGTLPGAYNPHICEVTRSGAGRAGGPGLHEGGGWRGEIAGFRITWTGICARPEPGIGREQN